MRVRLIVEEAELRLRSMHQAAVWLDLTEQQEAAMRKALQACGEWVLDNPAVLVLRDFVQA